MNPRIALRCECGAATIVARNADEPTNAVECYTARCPCCEYIVPVAAAVVLYYDADGRMMDSDGNYITEEDDA